MTVLEDIPVLDFPLQLLIGVVAEPRFHSRADRLWIALAKGILVSLVATTIPSVIFGTTR